MAPLGFDPGGDGADYHAIAADASLIGCACHRKPTTRHQLS